MSPQLGRVSDGASRSPDVRGGSAAQEEAALTSTRAQVRRQWGALIRWMAISPAGGGYFIKCNICMMRAP